MSPQDQNTAASYSGIARPVIWALAVVAVIFISYEIVERLWLQEADSSTLHRLHLFRGLFSSLVAALLVGWLLLKASPSLFSPSLASEPLARIKPPTDRERLDNFNRWFILMRWIAVLVAWLLTFLVVQVAEWLPQQVWWPLVLTIGALAGLNLIYEYVFRKGLLSRYLLPFQAYADLVVLIMLLHFSGGIENPLSLLMLFHVIIAGIVLNRRHCYAVAASASVLLAITAAGEATGILNHYTLTIFPHTVHEGELAHASHQPYYVISYLGLLSGIFFLTAYFVTTLADRIRHGEKQLRKFADHLLEQRRLIEKALETTEAGLCVCDGKGESVWTNRRWQSWFGKQTLDAFAGRHRFQDFEGVCQCLNSGKTHISELTLPANASGQASETVLRITTAPLADEQGRFDQVVSLAQDISEQKKAQKQLIRAGKFAAVGELAGHVAHEVNNPVGIISAKCRLLLGDHPDELTPRVHQELEKITAAADRVAHIAKGLLSYCRPSTSRRTVLDISSPVREAVAMISQRAKEMRVEIDDRLPGKLPPVSANADEIQQVFLNLFLNALDAMPRGGSLRLSVAVMEITGKQASRWLAITVQDSGEGIPDGIKEQIFEPFFSTKEESKGTGLGLSICDGLMRSHGGSIEVESEQGRGSTFTVRFPLDGSNSEGSKQGVDHGEFTHIDSGR